MEKLVEFWFKVYPDDFNDISMKLLFSNWRFTGALLDKIPHSRVGKKEKIPSDVTLTKQQIVKCRKMTETTKSMDDVLLIFLSDYPQYLAQQITWIDFDFLSRLNKKDILQFALNTNSGADPTIEAIRDEFNQTIQWIATTIVNHVQQGDTTAIFERFIHLGFVNLLFFLALNLTRFLL